MRGPRLTVYRLYDDAGTLLYIGCTGDLRARLLQHRWNTPWFGEATRVVASVYATECLADRAEIGAIATESARYNFMNTKRPNGDLFADGLPPVSRVAYDLATFLPAARRRVA